MTDGGGLGRAAQTYARAAIPVFPLAPRSKLPYKNSHGSQDATCDLEQVRGWWERDPRANIGIATGHGLVVIDADGAEGADVLLEIQRRYGPLPATAWVRTGRDEGGWQSYFRTDAPIPNSAGKIGSGLDVRGQGGYTVAPPSVHPSGRLYAWLDATPPALLPKWLERLLTPSPAPPPAPCVVTLPDTSVAAALRGEAERVARAPKGTRNHALNCSAFSLGQLVGAGRLDELRAREALLAASHACGYVRDDGEHRALATIASGLRSGRLCPRVLS